MVQELTTKVLTLDETRNVTLTCYLQPVGGRFDYVEKRPAIVVLPGGAYQYCSDREADPVAFAYLKAGYQVFILRYSVAEFCTWPTPLADYDQAMGLILEHADEWNLYPDKIAVIGFSAGGHLAAAAATMAMHRPNAAILGYAVTGNDVKGCSPTAPDCNTMVDEKTPPCFIFAARDDDVVPVMNSVHFMEALAKAGISFESHIYARGGHGFSTAEKWVQNPGTAMSERVPNWTTDSIGWLKEVFGEYDGQGSMTEPLVQAHVNGDYDATLSVNCTIGKLFAVPEAKAVLEPLVASMKSQQLGEDAVDPAVMQEMLMPVKLGDFMRFAGAPEEAVEKLDSMLRQIPNPAKK